MCCTYDFNFIPNPSNGRVVWYCQYRTFTVNSRLCIKLCVCVCSSIWKSATTPTPLTDIIHWDQLSFKIKSLSRAKTTHGHLMWNIVGVLLQLIFVSSHSSSSSSSSSSSFRKTRLSVDSGSCPLWLHRNIQLICYLSFWANLFSQNLFVMFSLWAALI